MKRQISWLGAPGMVGDQAACDALNAALTATKAKRDAIKGYLVELDAARIAAYQNGDTATGQALDAQHAGQQAALNTANVQINDLNNQLKTCMGLCDTGYTNVNGKCVPIGVTPPADECSATKPCLAGQECVSGKCVTTTTPPVSKPTPSKSSGYGLLLLGGAAAAGLLFLGPALFGKGGMGGAYGRVKRQEEELLENYRHRAGRRRY